MTNIWKKTRYSLYMGALDQAVLCNLAAILFIVFRTQYNLTFEQLGRIILLNFVTQMASDIVNGSLINKVKPRYIIVIGAFLAFLGYISFTFLPQFMSDPYKGILIGTVIFSWGCGTYEMMLSPLINAIPSDTKVQDMALLHSFYAWGVAFAVIFATAVFYFSGLAYSLCHALPLTVKDVFYKGLFNYWYLFPLIASIIPLVLIYNFSTMKMPEWISEEKRNRLTDFIFKPYFILCILVIAVGGGVECILSNWISIFAEKGLGYSKLIGDMIGLLGYAVSMGISRHLMGTRGENWDLSKVLIWSSFVAVLIYIFASLCPINAFSLILCMCGGFVTGFLWPGALNLAGLRFPFAGAVMFAILAFSGDLGVALIPWLNGIFADHSVCFSNFFAYIPDITKDAVCLRGSLLISSSFAVILLILHLIMRKIQKK